MADKELIPCHNTSCGRKVTADEVYCCTACSDETVTEHSEICTKNLLERTSTTDLTKFAGDTALERMLARLEKEIKQKREPVSGFSSAI